MCLFSFPAVFHPILKPNAAFYPIIALRVAVCVAVSFVNLPPAIASRKRAAIDRRHAIFPARISARSFSILIRSPSLYSSAVSQ